MFEEKSDDLRQEVPMPLFVRLTWSRPTTYIILPRSYFLSHPVSFALPQ